MLLVCAGDAKIERVLEAFNNSGLMHPGGIATSLRETGQQWFVERYPATYVCLLTCKTNISCSCPTFWECPPSMDSTHCEALGKHYYELKPT
jgi:hypothetical protein